MSVPTLDDARTLRMARELSLMKWEKVRTLKIELFNLIDQICGLCLHGKLKAHEEGLSPDVKCSFCGSSEFCDTLMKDFLVTDETMDELISRVLSHLRTMEVGD